MAMTYPEQLKHPNWQRRRLEVLSAADFKCSCCGDGDTTLNVHHKQYIKGRKAWEYEASELEALCVPCHERKHATEDWMKHVCKDKFCAEKYTNELALSVIAGLMIGSRSSKPDDVFSEIFVSDPASFLIGYAAAIIGPYKLYQLAMSLGDSEDPMIEAMGSYLKGESDGQS